MVDPTIEPTKRIPDMCYAGIPVKANRSAHGIAAACTLRNWLGMWSLRTGQTRAAPHLARVTRPALVINADADTGVFPSAAPRIYDALAGTDKARCSISTDHCFTTEGHVTNKRIPSPGGSRSGSTEGSGALRARSKGTQSGCARSRLA